MRVKLLITTEASCRVSRGLLESLTREAINLFAKKARMAGGVYQLNLILGSSQLLKKINSQFRNKNKTTDVISLRLWSNKTTDAQKILGEVYINCSLARKQARLFKHALNAEVAVLFLHGLLHILGLDHEQSPKKAQLMGQAEQKVLAAEPRLRGVLGVIKRA